VTAVTRTNLLVLDGNDLHALMDREPRVAARMHEMIRHKLGRELVSRSGDITTEEIEEAEDAGGRG
jgi:voltage-gated potassium channel